ncbi:MAG: sulfatase-like hydrolase/transferase [Spirochaetaceae bacterium]
MNVVIIHTDQQRFDSLGCTGNPGAVTPNLDRLAEEGNKFTRHFSTNPVCMPSRSSLLSGTYPSVHGVVINGIPLPRETDIPLGKLAKKYIESKGNNLISHIPTIGDFLKDKGFNTAAVGKLHITPTQCDPSFKNMENREDWINGKLKDDVGPYYGFDSFLPTIGHGEHTIGAYDNWLKLEYPEFNIKNDAAGRGEVGEYASKIPEQYHHSSWVGLQCCDYISNQKVDKPFFLFAGFPDPHHPWTPPEETLTEYRAIIKRNGVDKNEFYKHSSFDRSYNHSNILFKESLKELNLSKESISTIQEYTNAQNYLIDKKIGEIISSLKINNLYDDTIVVFTSDHGDYMGDFNLLRKNDLSAKALCHINLIVKDGKNKHSVLENNPSSNIDVFPTICDLLGYENPEWLQGSSVYKKRDELPMSQCIYFSNKRNLSIWDKEYHLIYFPNDNTIQLFYHPDDPYELNDCSNLPQYKKTKDELFMKLLKQSVDSLNPNIGRIANW